MEFRERDFQKHCDHDEQHRHSLVYKVSNWKLFLFGLLCSRKSNSFVRAPENYNSATNYTIGRVTAQVNQKDKTMGCFIDSVNLWGPK